MLNSRDVAAVVKALVDTQAYQAAKFLSENFVIRATKPRRKLGAWSNRYKRTHLVVTFGAPNYRERQHLRRLGKVPARVQLRDFPQSR